MGLVRARAPDQEEALGQRALVGQVVERGQQLAPGQVPGRPEDDQRRRVDREALEALDERVLVVAVRVRAAALLAHLRPFRRSVSSRSAAAGSSPASVTRSAGRSWERSVSRSPIACACLSRVKAKSASGMSTSALGVVQQLQEHALRRAALVQLAGGVQEARAVAERRRRVRRVADRGAQLLDGLVDLGRRREVAHDREVVRRPELARAAPSARRRRRRPGPRCRSRAPAWSRPWPPARWAGRTG